MYLVFLGRMNDDFNSLRIGAVPLLPLAGRSPLDDLLVPNLLPVLPDHDASLDAEVLGDDGGGAVDGLVHLNGVGLRLRLAFARQKVAPLHDYLLYVHVRVSIKERHNFVLCCSGITVNLFPQIFSYVLTRLSTPL